MTKNNWFNYTENSTRLETMKCPHCKKLISIEEKAKVKIKIKKWL